jgi:hypothetical protein
MRRLARYCVDVNVDKEENYASQDVFFQQEGVDDVDFGRKRE